MPRTIGLLGGTFNPVHEGHLSIAREALRLFALDAAAIHLPPPWPERLLADLRSGEPLDVSSREIRAKIAAGQPVSLVPESVLRYIEEHNLYR